MTSLDTFCPECGTELACDWVHTHGPGCGQLEHTRVRCLDTQLAKEKEERRIDRDCFYEAYKIITGVELDSVPCEGGRPHPGTAVIVALQDRASELHSLRAQIISADEAADEAMKQLVSLRAQVEQYKTALEAKVKL